MTGTLSELQHIPVLVEETMLVLKPELGSLFLDGTVGLGGHAREILERSHPDSRLMAIDRDVDNLKVAERNLAKFANRLTTHSGSYSQAAEFAKKDGLQDFDGILLDIGFSSVHVDKPERGFSFQKDGPLDMRYDRTTGDTAADIVNWSSPDQLAYIFRVYGEERRATRLAEAIVKKRKEKRFETTLELADCISEAIPKVGRLHPATKAFQALRIVVNSELDELEKALPTMIDLLGSGGRLAIISFHSLEDRIVKHYFKQIAKERDDLELITKKPITATQEEIQQNPRARSAKLRAIKKI